MSLQARWRLLAAIYFLVLSSAAEARICNPENPGEPCRLQSGGYFIRTPDFEAPLARYPLVMILHDAGGSAEALFNDRRLTEMILGRGFAIMAPMATEREYVRYSVFEDGREDERESTEVKRSRSNKGFVIRDPDGSLRRFASGTETGWYFYNVDVGIVREPARTAGETRIKEIKRLGRDEAGFIREALFDAEQRFWIDPRKVLVIGVGHGGSLAWQLACEAPEIALLFAPVNGAYWDDVPEECKQGARLVHSNYRKDSFWPMRGKKGSRRLFKRTGIFENLATLARGNACYQEETQTSADEFGFPYRAWTDCAFGSSVDLVVLDEPFAFQDWWLEDILDRFEAAWSGDWNPYDERPVTRPKFVRP